MMYMTMLERVMTDEVVKKKVHLPPPEKILAAPMGMKVVC